MSSSFAGAEREIIAALLHEGLFSADHLAELIAKPLARINGVELDVPEGVARRLLGLWPSFR